MPYPIIRWLGGKRRLAAQILPLFPPHECYVEPFCGGAALYFLRPEPAKVEVLNDINGDIANLYRVVQNHLEEFVRQFRFAISSRQVFEWTREQVPEAMTDIQRAARFYYLQRHAFGARAVKPVFGTATTSAAPNLMRIEESLSEAHLRLTGTFIEHLPWEECMRRYDRPHTFFYCDPPYWKVAGYGTDFSYDEYCRLAQFMQTSQGRVMLSINDHPQMRELFSEFCIQRLQIRYSVGNHSKKPVTSHELIVTNWTLPET